MSDARALLKAKRQEARVQHPHALYTSTGQLRCAACETAIKQASAWAGHIGSKLHRENVAKRRKTQPVDLDQEAVSTGKRKVEQGGSLDEEEACPNSEPKKRKVTPDVPSKPTPENSWNFPSNFFSDPSRAPIRSVEDDTSDEDKDGPTSIQQAVSKDPIDLEWQRFQQEMLASAPPPDDQRHETFKRATISVEPKLLQDNVLGLSAQESTHVELPRDEEESRKRKEEEEKELIMDRLLEEERAQEEADAKVALLKGRLEALKKRRSEAKVSRGKKSQ